MKRELEKLYDHIDDIEIAMMTTRRPTVIFNRGPWQRRSARKELTSGSSR